MTQEDRIHNAIAYATRVIEDEAAAVHALVDQLDDNFTRAVDMIYHIKGKVIVTGVGKSGNIGAKMASTFSSTGTPAIFINPLDAYHGDLGAMTADDVVIAISNSGQTDELLRFIPLLQHMNVPIIGMSRNPESLLAKYSTVHIKAYVEKEACPLNLAPTSSTTAMLAMGDALAVALMQVRNFKPKDFAQFHPGGTLGRRLLTTAEDVMHTEALPIIPEDMHLGDAIIRVSAGKLGLGISLDPDGHVTGIITDGDIRRAMERWKADFFNHTVADIMTTSPKQVKPTARIAEIDRVMHKYKIHSVLVVDSDNKLVGVVDSYAAALL